MKAVEECICFYQRHLQQPHQHRQQVLDRGCPGAWGGASMCAACLFLISTPLTLRGFAINTQGREKKTTKTVKRHSDEKHCNMRHSFKLCVFIRGRQQHIVQEGVKKKQKTCDEDREGRRRRRSTSEDSLLCLLRGVWHLAKSSYLALTFTTHAFQWA